MMRKEGYIKVTPELAAQTKEFRLPRYLLLNQSGHPRSRELELEIMRLRNEINKIGVNVNQIVKNNNSHIYSVSDKMELKSQVNRAADLMERMAENICASNT